MGYARNFKSFVWIKLSCFVIMGAFHSASVHAAKPFVPPSLEWERTIEDKVYSYESRATCLTRSGELVILGIRKPVAEDKGKSLQTAWIATFRPDGSRSPSIEFGANLGRLEIRDLDAIASIGDATYAIVGRSGNGNAFLAHINALGKITYYKDLGRRRFTTILPDENGQVILAGYSGSDSLLQAVSAKGESVLEDSRDRGKDESFVAAVTDGEQVILIENSGKREQFFLTDSTVSLSRFRIGQPIGNPAFVAQGRGGSVALGQDRIVIVYDAGSTSSQLIKAAILDKDLRRIRDDKIFDVKFGLERFKVSRVGEHSFLVVGTGSGNLFMALIDEDGRIRWEDIKSGPAFYMHADTAGNQFSYVVSTAMTLTEQRKRKLSVQVFKVRVQG